MQWELLSNKNEKAHAFMSLRSFQFGGEFIHNDEFYFGAFKYYLIKYYFIKNCLFPLSFRPLAFVSC